MNQMQIDEFRFNFKIQLHFKFWRTIFWTTKELSKFRVNWFNHLPIDIQKLLYLTKGKLSILTSK